MKKVKSLFVLIIISLVFLNSCELFSPGIIGEGTAIEQTMNIKEIEGFQVSIAADVIVTYGDTQEIKIIGEQNIIENIETNVSNKIWNIKFDKRVKKHDDIIIYITIPKISEVSVSGASNIVVNEGFPYVHTLEIKVSGLADIDIKGLINCSYFDYSVSGSAETNIDSIICGDNYYSQVSGSDELNINYMYCDEATVDISGSSDITYNGVCNTQNIYASGVIDYHAQYFVTNNTYIDVSGSADIWCNAQSILDIRVSGIAHVRYVGTPTIFQSASGLLTLENI